MPLSRSQLLEWWNRRLHYYLGLYFLFFLWLFSLTGLLLNHPMWRFAQFWPDRRETSFEQPLHGRGARSALDQARLIMRELALAGEIDWPPQQTPGRLEFTVNRPGLLHRVSADMNQNRVTVTRTEVNAWGVMYFLHTFSGTRVNNPAATRDWMLTSVWVMAMDAVAAGLLLIVFTSYYMWYRLKPKRRLGLISLGAGVVCCGVFVAGLAWLR